MRYLLTGGAGFLGAALARRLHYDGHAVTILDDLSRGQANRVGDLLFDDGRNVLVKGSITDPRAVEFAMRDVDSVVHLAMVQGTQNFTENPRKTQDVALGGTLNLLLAMEKHKVRDLMLISSSEAYQGERDKIPTDESVWLSVPDVLNPRFAYGGGKLAMELVCAAYQMDGVLDRLIIARPHNVYGPDMGREHVIPEFCLRLKEMLGPKYEFGTLHDLKIQGTGEETRSFCYISDCVDALALLLDKAPKGPSIWHVGTQDERNISDVAHATARNFGVRVNVIPGKLPKGSPPRRCPDISKLRGLGYQPKVGFDEGMAFTVPWYRENG